MLSPWIIHCLLLPITNQRFSEVFRSQYDFSFRFSNAITTAGFYFSDSVVSLDSVLVLRNLLMVKSPWSFVSGGAYFFLSNALKKSSGGCSVQQYCNATLLACRFEENEIVVLGGGRTGGAALGVDGPSQVLVSSSSFANNSAVSTFEGSSNPPYIPPGETNQTEHCSNSVYIARNAGNSSPRREKPLNDFS